MVTRRQFGALAAAASVPALLMHTSARAQAAFPNRPVQLIVPFPAGGTTDTLARVVADALGKGWGQTVVVQNRAGATGVIGTRLVAQAAPDGYTLVFAIDSSQITAGLLNPPAPYDPVADFSPISEIARGQFVLVCHPAIPAANVRELVAYAKANPGKMSFGSSGIGTTPHLLGELFKLAAGIDIVHVPYAGAAAFQLALRTGELQLGFLSSTEAIAAQGQGHVRALATPSARRVTRLPDVPTMAQTGFPDVRDESSFGILGPGGMDKALVDKISADLRRVLQQPELRRRIAALDYTLVLGSPADYAAALTDATQRKRKLITEAKIGKS